MGGGGTVDRERIVFDDFTGRSFRFEGFQRADRRRSHPTKHLFACVQRDGDGWERN